MLRPDEIASIRRTVADFLSDLIVLYAADDADGATPVWDGRCRLTNDRSLTSRRDASDFSSLTLPAGVAVAPGMLARHAPSGTLSDDDVWYLVAKTGDDTATTLSEQAMLLALPLALSVERAVPTAPTGSPRRFDNSGAPLPTTGQTDASLVTTTTIRAALSTDYGLRQDGDGAGPVATALRTLLAPLGAAVSEGDVVTVPDVGTGAPARYRVANRQTAQANGQPYAYQLILKNLV